MSQYFENLDIGSIKDALIFLDIDGTLVADNDDIPAKSVLAKVESLSARNVVWLCSNSFNDTRNQAVQRRTGLQIIRGHRKPSMRILNQVDKKDLQRRIIVIGDKILTDGFFAKRTGAEFIKVKRKVGNDRLRVKLYSLLDDIAYFFFKKLF